MKTRKNEGIIMNDFGISLLAYAEDIVLLGKDKCKMVDLCYRLIKLAKKIGLHINLKKPEYMKENKELDNTPLTDTRTP